VRTERGILDWKKEWKRENNVAESGRFIDWVCLFVVRR